LGAIANLLEDSDYLQTLGPPGNRLRGMVTRMGPEVTPGLPGAKFPR
jgi:hypothetical protein